MKGPISQSLFYKMAIICRDFQYLIDTPQIKASKITMVSHSAAHVETI
ncbi:hypothetical protein ACVWYG_000237 [Pedobacter sp. UYEF25]